MSLSPEAGKLARAAAADLKAEFPGLEAATNAALAGSGPPPRQATRGFLETWDAARDISEIASFLIIITPYAMTKWQEFNDPARVKSEVSAEVVRPHSMPAFVAEKLIDVVVGRLRPKVR